MKLEYIKEVLGEIEPIGWILLKDAIYRNTTLRMTLVSVVQCQELGLKVFIKKQLGIVEENKTIRSISKQDAFFL